MSWEPKYDVGFIDEEFIVPIDCLYGGYTSMNRSKGLISSERLRYFYNKYNMKKEFEAIGFHVPDLYLYTKNEICEEELLKYDGFVAKPAHMSDSDNVLINKTIYLKELNNSLNKTARLDAADMFNASIAPWKECERGIIIEELINVIYELKVFVVWGSPLIVDLRIGASEFARVDFIDKENTYLNWDHEYELIEKFAETIKIDFFRIDFLYDGKILYASELEFMPGTILPKEIETFIEIRWQKLYYQHYYGMR
jgi:hypothetical protein